MTTTAYGARALAGELAKLAGATPGVRNNTLNAVWIKLCQRINAGHLDRDEAWQRVYDIAQSIGLDDREIRATMNSAENGARTHPWNVPPPKEPGQGFDGFAQPGGRPSDNATSTGGTEPATQQAAFLPDPFWRERPSLDHIRQAAWSRGRSAEAVLGSILARIAADTPHFVKLPAIVGQPCGLTLIVALTGPPGSGKSSSKGVAVELLPHPHLIKPECDDIPPGSGEGMLEVLFDYEEDENGRKVKTLKRHNAFMYADEGEVLAMQARRNTSNTILPTLRSAFTDATLGQANASIERKRRIPAGRYVYGIVLGIQPDKAAELLGDAGGGTPQRFLWMPTDAPTPPPGERPQWPGPIEWPRFENTTTDPKGRIYIHIPDDIAQEIAHRDHHKQTHGVEAMDEHADLIRMKVAAVLALLDQRRNITTTDWQLAEAVMLVSTGTRARVQAEVTKQNEERNRARGHAKAVENTIVRDKEETDDTHKAMKAIRRKLQRANGEWVNQSALRDVCGKVRDQFAPAVEAMTETGEIEGEEFTNRGNTTNRYRLTANPKGTTK